MEESKKSDPSQTLIPYKKSKEISRLQVEAPARKYVQAARRGTGCHGILVPAAQSRDCKSKDQRRGTQSRKQQRKEKAP